MEGGTRMTSSARITSSKGNQNKWCKNGKWYKVDGLGYEALSEVVVSHLLRKSTITSFVYMNMSKWKLTKKAIMHVYQRILCRMMMTK